MSKLGWIDFSPDDRNKVKNVLALLSEPGTLDELGIGQIRDAYSDMLFPGISTIQTRAKYFITVPRILRDYQVAIAANKKRYQNLQNFLMKQENEVARLLAENHGEGQGVIGFNRISQGGVDRRPSEIYWNGLRTLGLVRTAASLADFCRLMDREDSHSVIDKVELEEGIDDKLEQHSLVRLPDRNPDWMEKGKLSLHLSRLEAAFLKGKLVETPAISHSVPAQLFKHDLLKNMLSKSPQNVLSRSPQTDVKTFDLLVEVLVTSDAVDQQCKDNIQLAQEFSLAMEGPHIRYNLLLAKHNNFDDKVKGYEDDYKQWKGLFTHERVERWLAIDNEKHRIKPKAKSFVHDCRKIIQDDANVAQLDKCVKARAEANKGPRSLLNKKLNNNGWVGIRRLVYRWGTAKTILSDIQEGLDAGA